MDPKYAPKMTEQKIAWLIEECGEVLAAAGKTLRFGPDCFNPEPGASRETNRAWLLREIMDLEHAIRAVWVALDKP